MRGVSDAIEYLVTKTTWSCLTCVANTASKGKIIIPALLGVSSLGCFFSPSRIARIARVVHFDKSPISMSTNFMKAFDKNAHLNQGSGEEMVTQTAYFSITLAAAAMVSYVILNKVAQTAHYYTGLQDKFLFPRISNSILIDPV